MSHRRWTRGGLRRRRSIEIAVPGRAWRKFPEGEAKPATRNRLLKNSLDMQNRVVREQVTAPIPRSVRHLVFGQAAVQPQVGTLNRVFQQPVIPPPSAGATKLAADPTDSWTPRPVFGLIAIHPLGGRCRPAPMVQARLKSAVRPGGMPKPVRQDAEGRRPPFREFPSRGLASVGPARDPFKPTVQPRACRPRPAVRGISWPGNAGRGGLPGMCMIPLSGAKAGRFRALRRGRPVRDASTARQGARTGGRSRRTPSATATALACGPVPLSRAEAPVSPAPHEARGNPARNGFGPLSGMPAIAARRFRPLDGRPSGHGRSGSCRRAGRQRSGQP